MTEETICGIGPENPVSFHATQLVQSIKAHCYQVIRPVASDVSFSKRGGKEKKERKKDSREASDYMRSTRDDEAIPEIEGGSHSSANIPGLKALGSKSVFFEGSKRLYYTKSYTTGVGILLCPQP